ncbi:MAG: hypothetical protein U9O65_08020 [Thermotogota bacterium]|nr:hypothetical protein [Thermotogota bacterium]
MHNRRKEIKMISKNVMKTAESDNDIFYRVVCGCGSNEHDIGIHFEIEDNIPHTVFLNFYKKVAWCSNWGDLNFFERMWHRIKASIVMLFTGYIDTEESFIIDTDNIDGLMEALKEGKEYIEKGP